MTKHVLHVHVDKGPQNVSSKGSNPVQIKKRGGGNVGTGKSYKLMKWDFIVPNKADIQAAWNSRTKFPTGHQWT